jgi:phage tail-like protein
MSYYLPGFRFNVTLGAFSIGFSSVSGVERDTEVYTYQEGGLNDRVHVFSKPAAAAGTLAMEKGVCPLSANPFYMVGERIDVPLTLQIMKKIKTPAKTYVFTDCVVKKWSVSRLSASESTLMIDTFEVAYGGFTVL